MTTENGETAPSENKPAPQKQDNTIPPLRITAPGIKIGETTDERPRPRSE